jgi:uncharacterized protein YeaO (DUF488 family)
MTLPGSLWTGRIYDYKKIKETFPNIKLICVMRWPPRYINFVKEGIEHIDALAPSISLLQWYKKEREGENFADEFLLWHEYLRRFHKEFRESELAQEARFNIRADLHDGYDIVLLCHERADENCHRRALPYLILNDGEEDIYKGEMKFDSEQGQLDW